MMNLTSDTSLALMHAAQAHSASTGQQAKTAAKEGNLARFDAVAKDFEAMFLSEMMKPMFAGIKPDARFGGGKGEEIFRGLMLQEYGKLMAETGQLGIAGHVKQELIRMQEKADGGPAHL